MLAWLVGACIVWGFVRGASRLEREAEESTGKPSTPRTDAVVKVTGPVLRPYQRDEGDENTGIQTEGLGVAESAFGQLLHQLHAENPRLTRKQVTNIIVARCRTASRRL